MIIDIAFNATSQEVLSNLSEIIQRAKKSNIMPIFVGLDIESSKQACLLAKTYNTCCYVGIHPLHLNYSAVREEMNIGDWNFEDENICGIGECGLDYFRSDKKKEQIEVFKEHLRIQKLPYFYHCRNSFEDFFQVLSEEKSFKVFHGVVHSFDGSIEEARQLISQGLYIGINGCSLKTEEGVEVVKKLPVDKILVETDSPFCLIRRSYAGSRYSDLIKSRFNEPSFVRQIVEVVAKIKEMEIDELEEILYKNTLDVFPKLKKFTEFWNES